VRLDLQDQKVLQAQWLAQQDLLVLEDLQDLQVKQDLLELHLLSQDRQDRQDHQLLALQVQLDLLDQQVQQALQAQLDLLVQL
jgi:hypothetical protein